MSCTKKLGQSVTKMLDHNNYNRIIYMSKDMFKLYERGLSEPDGIELRRGF